ncbi:hypothetical protein LTR69_008510 [Exophiala sideris]|uniref:Flavin-binding monooxygenase n=1 Tax=Exophiala sideris TaxID=1016849 RepID=A0ABR0J360_9EURO|nr:hypothetical protein LTR69_008510 [Exophiala sideris]
MLLNSEPLSTPSRRILDLEDRSVDQPRSLRVVVIGAGISGILASIRFPQRIPGVQLAVYEKNADVGGTWLENRYPGCACDIPAHTYQATFEPNPDWSRFYASAEEIHRYWKRLASKYGATKYIHLKQEVVEARWDEGSAKWTIRILDLTSDVVYSDTCDVLISGTGALNNWKWPSVPGLQDFQGKLLHSASWDEKWDWQDKAVAVIGNGSSGIQIVPAMLPDAKRIDHYVRGRTWLSPTFARAKVDELGQGLDNFSFSPELIQAFKKDSRVYQKFRKALHALTEILVSVVKDIERELQSNHKVVIKGSADQLIALEIFTENMRRRLSQKPELLDLLLPAFPPACRRLTPGPGYLEALASPKTELITQAVSKVDKTGITTTDGRHRQVDAIVCATGFDTSFSPRFPIYGKDGVSLAEKWKSFPSTYIAVATAGFPNYFISLGPNAALGTGNLLLLIERQLDYFTTCVAKMQTDNIRTMVPLEQAVETFRQYCARYFERTVYTSQCKSWYKGGKEDGPISALWPGSSLHASKIYANPRWEDYEYEYIHDNPLGWLGDGWTQAEKDGSISVDYLDDDRVDFPPLALAVVDGLLQQDSIVTHHNDLNGYAAQKHQD